MAIIKFYKNNKIKTFFTKLFIFIFKIKFIIKIHEFFLNLNIISLYV